jgi:hypothetical protein
MKALLGLFVMLAACATTPSADGVGTRIQVQVVDEEGKPIPTAVIRHPEEEERHRVNAVTGTWEEEVLYMPDGSELIFTPGLLLYLEVSAPNYESQVVQYQVRRRRNALSVSLKKLQMQDLTIDEPMMSFGRDAPIDSGEGGGGPAN